MDKKKFIGIITIFLCLSFVTSLFAETITFKSGAKKEGKVIEKTNDYIKVEYAPGTIVTYPFAYIKSIDEKTLTKIPIKTILPEAIKKNDVLAVKKAIEEGADVNAEVMLSHPLTLAAFYNSLDVARLLLEKDADVNAPDISFVSNHGKRALGWAAFSGHLEMVRLLVEKGADVNLGDDVTTPLMDCSFWPGSMGKEEDKLNRLEIAKLLIAKGADVNAKGLAETALMLAASSNFLEMAELLIAKGADVNAKIMGSTALIGAASLGSLETAKLLIAKGADINPKDRDGNTALMYAVKGAYLNSEESHLPLPIKKANFFQIVKLLVEKGADVNATNKDGDTALKIAEKEGNKEIAAYLKKHGAK